MLSFRALVPKIRAQTSTHIPKPFLASPARLKMRRCLGSLSTSVLSTLPPHSLVDVLPIRDQLLSCESHKLIVLDDDPTGTQTVHGVNVLCDFSVESICRELQSPNNLFYLLTNTRAMDEEAAMRLTNAIVKNIATASSITGTGFRIISRGDSTLRGHFPAETDAIMEGLYQTYDGTIILPAFFEGGRITFNDIHYVQDGDQLVPVGDTPFARDPAFGYTSSNLKDWVEEKTKGAVQSSEVISISLRDIRQGGPSRVTYILENMTQNSYVIVNCAHPHDLEIFVVGLLQAEVDGYDFLYRTAASFVSTRAGISPRPLLTTEEITNTGSSHSGGLIVVGSYVPKTSEQLLTLLEMCEVVPIELSVSEIINGNSQKVVDDAVSAIDDLLRTNKHVCIYTTRELFHNDGVGGLRNGKLVSDALTDTVRRLTHTPSYIIAKGGITSHDVAEKALRAKRSLVLGQAHAGVPVWQLGPESKYPNSRYVVFPGNVGTPTSLAEVAIRCGAPARNPNPFTTRSTAASSITWPHDFGKTVEVVRNARENKRAVAAFNVYNMEGAKAAVAAAEELKSPIILQIHPASLDFGGLPFLVYLKSLSKDASVPVCVHGDHLEHDEHVQMALEAGVDSIMVDGSGLPYTHNVAWTKAWTRRAHERGIAVEAELGRLVGEEDGLSVSEKEAKMTDPDLVAEFVEETEVDLLAVTIGNVHGRYKHPPVLDLGRLERIRSFTSVPLVLHGASGLAVEHIRAVIHRGVCKFNVNTDLREAYINALKDALAQKQCDVLPAMRLAQAAMTDVAKQKIVLFSNN